MKVVCLECQTKNSESALVCTKCHASLRAARAIFYLDRAEAEISKGQYDAASHAISKADADMLMLTTAQRESLLLTARAFWLQSGIYFYKKMWAEAEQELLLACANLEGHSEGVRLLALVYNRLGSVASYLDRLKEARDYYQLSSNVAIQVGDYATASRATANLGIDLNATGEREAAVTLFEQAFKYAETSQDYHVTAQMCRLLADMYATYGPFNLAIEYSERCINLAEQIDDVYVRALCFISASTTYQRYGDISQAVNYLHTAYDNTRGTDNRIIAEAVILAIANLMRVPEFDEYSEAWMLQLIGDFHDNINDVVSMGEYALSMNYYYIKQQDWHQLHRLSQKLKQITTSTNDIENNILLAAASTLCHAALGDWETAAQHYAVMIDSTLETYYRASVSEDYAKLLLNRAAVNPSPAIYAQAHDALERAVSLYQEIGLPHIAAKVEAMIPAVTK